MTASIQTLGSGPLLSAKRAVASGVRRAHGMFLTKPLPPKIAIYFHELEERQWPAFGEAICHFTDLGYRCAGASEFAQRRGAEPLLFVSFDDNFASWHRSLDFFAGLGLSATFYVNTLPFRDECPPDAIDLYFDRLAHRGERCTLSTAELRDLAAAGHTIGCHSHSHFELSQLSAEQWDAEIHLSKTILEDIAGTEVGDFSYPYGMRRFFSEPLRSYCSGLGFKTVSSGIPGLQHEPVVDPLNLHRTRWNLSRSIADNLSDICIDGRLFERITGRSAVA